MDFEIFTKYPAGLHGVVRLKRNRLSFCDSYNQLISTRTPNKQTQRSHLYKRCFQFLRAIDISMCMKMNWLRIN
ncbi:CLUMA_CG020811, isoform A [Clunio marinus]|uniref:CLUMA_CG020811, isoform A n=1 Tax=Clunio marinus TaxID=568069 RepID=A0A1J1JA05_9DIPT|nr:CLUMA_CG020811, isoform A [Clunio marinus]